MVSEISLQQEGAKIAREAEHSTTFHAAQAELGADLKKMTPGNYAEVLRQTLNTNRADVRSNPTLPDLYLETSKGSLMPDRLVTKAPSQGEVAERIFMPPTKSRYANFGHVLLNSYGNPLIGEPSAHPNYNQPSLNPDSQEMLKGTRPTPPKPWYK